MEAAYPVMGILQPLCDRVEFAGSIRRLRPVVGDVEIICIPKVVTDLLGEVNEEATAFVVYSALESAGYKMIKNGPYFKQFDLGNILCELHLTTPEKWGVKWLITTGSEEYSHNMVTPRQKYGYMPSNLHVKECRVWDGKTALDTPEEIDIFKIYGLEFVPPNKRIQ
jgi:DNA polymerase/3'-5' exonuclease PolX